MELRPFQAALVEGARAHLRRGIRRLLIQLATGGGKTVIAAFIIGGVRTRGLRVWFVVHRKELIRQTSATFQAVGIAHGFIAADFPIAGHELVQLCGVQTLALRLDTVTAPDVIIWDEAHHGVAATWALVQERFPAAIHIGLSATPCDLAGRALGAHFDAMICGPSTAELIRMGFLSRFTYFAPGAPDLVGVRAGDDFNRGDLGDLMDRPQIVGDVVEQYRARADGEQGIVFAVNREHSWHLAAAFNAAGIPAAHVDGSMSARERDRFDAAFRAGDIRVGCNVDLFGEGYDVPNIGYVGLVRPTSSLRLHRQQCGRALRIAPGKAGAVILDHAGNALRGLGLPDDDVVWSLEGKKKGSGGRLSDGMPIHQCPGCYQVTPSSVRECPGCGHAFTVEARQIAATEGELFELKRLGIAEREVAKRAAAEARKREEREAKTLVELVRLGRERGYPKAEAWARRKIELRQQYARGGRRAAGAR